MLAGLLDLAVVGALSAAASLAWFAMHPAQMPPRYWNQLDYLVDLINHHPDVVLPPVVAFVGVFLVWETLFVATIGNAPFARLFGMRVVTWRGRSAGPVRAFLRAALALVLAAAVGAGPLWAVVSPRRRMLHDILCGCHVLRGVVRTEPRRDDETPDVGGPAWEAGPRR